MGIGIMFIVTLYWLKRRMDKKNSDDIKIPSN
jgi:hypothetical protein